MPSNQPQTPFIPLATLQWLAGLATHSILSFPFMRKYDLSIICISSPMASGPVSHPLTRSTTGRVRVYTEVGMAMVSILGVIWKQDRPAPHHMRSATRTKRGTWWALRSKMIGGMYRVMSRESSSRAFSMWRRVIISKETALTVHNCQQNMFPVWSVRVLFQEPLSCPTNVAAFSGSLAVN